MKKVSLLSVFVASPSDVAEERECLETVIRELNLQWYNSRGIRLELVRWETHAYPGVSSDPQAVINEQIDNDYDIFIGILWKTFGTFTPRAGSGTEEEFNRAYMRYKNDPSSLRIMVYFKTAKVDLADIDPAQLGLRNEFQSRLGPKGTLYWQFDSIEDFASLVRIHLSRCVEDWGKSWGTASVEINAGSELSIDTSPSVEAEEEGFLDLLESMTQNFEDLQEQAQRLATSTENFSKKMSERTEEISRTQAESREFNVKAMKKICNAAADNLETYATIMDTEVPIFAAKFMGCHRKLRPSCCNAPRLFVSGKRFPGAT